MGNWAIMIHGCGQHHNKLDPHDANRMAADFVQRLRDAGHVHVEAAFVHGGADAVDAGKAYLETRDEHEKAGG